MESTNQTAHFTPNVTLPAIDRRRSTVSEVYVRATALTLLRRSLTTREQDFHQDPAFDTTPWTLPAITTGSVLDLDRITPGLIVDVTDDPIPVITGYRYICPTATTILAFILLET